MQKQKKLSRFLDKMLLKIMNFELILDGIGTPESFLENFFLQPDEAVPAARVGCA